MASKIASEKYFAEQNYRTKHKIDNTHLKTRNENFETVKKTVNREMWKKMFNEL